MNDIKLLKILNIKIIKSIINTLTKDEYLILSMAFAFLLTNKRFLIKIREKYFKSSAVIADTYYSYIIWLIAY